MSIAIEIIVHIFRTLFAIAAVVAFNLLVVERWFPEDLQTWATLANYLAFGYFWYKWSPYWAPISRAHKTYAWTHPEKGSMETRVELAHTAYASRTGTSISQRTWRVSIYDLNAGYCVTRVVVGSKATFLGHHGDGIWFYVPDRFHSGFDGLVRIDVKSGELTYREPKQKALFLGRADEQGKVLLQRDGAETTFDLRDAMAA